MSEIETDAVKVEKTTEEMIREIYTTMKNLEANLLPAIEKISSGGIMGLFGRK